MSAFRLLPELFSLSPNFDVKEQRDYPQIKATKKPD